MFKKEYLAFIISVIFLSLIIGYSVLAWQPAPPSPPSDNVDIPLNVGSNPQIKSAGLQLESLIVRGGANLATVSGNVGIGTTSPSNLVHLSHSLGVNAFSGAGVTVERSSQAKIELYAGHATYGGGLVTDGNRIFLTTGGNVTTPEFVVATTGNVGIGTTSPTRNLDVAGTMRLRGHLYDVNNSAGSNNQILTRTASGPAWSPAPGVWGSCSTTSWTCDASQTCPNNTFMIRVDRGTTISLCGSGATMWYQMRMRCCTIQ